ncbi:MAG: amidase family protein, partial [Verrucomicrobiota bacterium]|nr:amidase family protein [Verrucomicrobiota bacterium]
MPFAVKDNIDVAGCPTSAGCPDFTYQAEENAWVVKLLLEAGGLLIGKTNMDQFATGLVGTRSPYGVPANAFDPKFIPGGSSSGSAVALAKGLVSFSLGTDTAGSGRVPASFQNLLGFKPTRGRLSCRGIVPACRSLDCVSVFGLQTSDLVIIEKVLSVHDSRDPFSRKMPGLGSRKLREVPRVAILPPEQLEFFGDALAQDAYNESIEVLSRAGLN